MEVYQDLSCSVQTHCVKAVPLFIEFLLLCGCSKYDVSFEYNTGVVRRRRGTAHSNRCIVELSLCLVRCLLSIASLSNALSCP